MDEALSLELSDVDLQNDVVTVRKGKGNKGRVVPFSHSLKISLSRYIEPRNTIAKECTRFFVSRGDFAFTKSGAKKFFKKLKKKTKIDFSAHKLRHTYATLLTQGGCDIYTLSKLMGHSNIKTTTVYLSATVAQKREQIMKHPLNQI